MRPDIQNSVLSFSTRQKQEILKGVELTKDQDEAHIKENIDKFINSKGYIDQHLVKEIRIILTTRKTSYVEYFIQRDGISILLSLIKSTNLLSTEKVKSDVGLQNEVMLCLSAIITTIYGIESLMDKEKLNSIVLMINSAPQTCQVVCNFFSIIALYSPEGHKMVINALDHFKLVTREKRRFLTLVDSFEREVANPKYTTAVLCLINSLLSTKDIPTRMSLQREVVELGFGRIVKSIQIGEVHIPEDLASQISIFEKAIGDYELKFSDFTDPEKIARSIFANLTGTEASSHYLNILHYLYYTSQNSIKEKNSIENWKTLDNIVKKSITKEKVVEMNENELKLMDKISQLEGMISQFDQYKRHFSKNLHTWTEKDVVIDEHLGDSKMVFEVLNRYKKEKEEIQVGLEKEIIALKQKINSMEKTPSQSPMSGSFGSQSESMENNQSKIEDVPQHPVETLEVSIPSIMVAPPPMIPTMPKLNLPELPTLKPLQPIKTFHCNEVPMRKVSETIFIKSKITENMKYVSIEESKLLELFAIKPKTVDLKVKKQEEVITLLDQNRSYNISILLKAIGSNYENLVEAIQEMPKDFDLEKIASLIKIIPTPEELEIISRYNGTSNLAESDKFFVALKNIYNLKQRVESWYFKRSYRSIKFSIEPELDTILKAIKEMKESKQFCELLGIVLAIANYMSGKKKVYGFKMSSLVKLCDTKTSDNKSNLLKYLVDYIHRTKPDLNFIKELETVPRACRIQMEMIKNQIKVVSDGLKLLNDQLDNPNMDQEFISKMSDFREEVIFDLNRMNDSMSDCKKGLSDLSKLYDDEQVIDKPSDFFSHISTFIDMYVEAEKELKNKSKHVEVKHVENKKMEPIKINMTNVAEILRARFRDDDDDE